MTDWAGYEAVLDRLVAEHAPAIPGIAVAVLEGDARHPWSSGRGANPNGCFRIASVTKTFLAAACLRLQRDGLLNLARPLAAQPSTEATGLLAHNGFDVDQITPFQLLAHTSGLPDHSSDPSFVAQILAEPGRRWTRAEQLRLALRRGPLALPGEQTHYSDSGYLVVADLVETITGLSLGAAVREALRFGTLGLSQTWWERSEPPPAVPVPRLRQLVGERDQADLDASVDVFGGGGLISTVVDLARFAQALLRGEVLSSPEDLALMKEPGACAGPGALTGLGLFALPSVGVAVWGHTGFWGTVMASVDGGKWSMAAVVTQAPAFGGFDPTGLPGLFLGGRP